MTIATFRWQSFIEKNVTCFKWERELFAKKKMNVRLFLRSAN
jgi:hypothetical protein